MKPSDWSLLQKKVRFGDCDSAGVIHFHNLLKWSHEAWEESIEIYGIPYQDIFPDFSKRRSQIIFPIVNCEANFCLLYTSPSPRDRLSSRMPSSA